MYSIAELLNPLGKPIDRIRLPTFVKVARSQLVIWCMARKHVQDTDHDGVGNRQARALFTTTRRQASARSEATW
jgi:hypothetical protein